MKKPFNKDEGKNIISKKQQSLSLLLVNVINDNKDEIKNAIQESFEKSKLVTTENSAFVSKAIENKSDKIKVVKKSSIKTNIKKSRK